MEADPDVTPWRVEDGCQWEEGQTDEGCESWELPGGEERSVEC